MRCVQSTLFVLFFGGVGVCETQNKRVRKLAAGQHSPTTELLPAEVNYAAPRGPVVQHCIIGQPG